MLAYILRRILIMIPTLLGVTIIVFLMLHATPGDPAELLMGERATEESLEQLREHLGLNEPLHVQYGLFLSRLLKGDLGETIWTRQKVWIEIKHRFPATIELSLVALCISCFAGMLLGIISATKQYSIFDYASMIGALAGLKEVTTGDTLCAEQQALLLENIVFPEPVIPTMTPWVVRSRAAISRGSSSGVRPR